MKRIVLARGVAITAAMLGGSSLAAQPAKSITDSVTVTATVEAIDKTNRLVTLKGEKTGKLVTVEVDTAVRRFDQLKVGDRIRATYYESFAINVRKPGDPVPKAYDTAFGRLPGDKPGAKGVIKETVSVTVLAIDKPNKAVTVKRKDGTELSMRVENPAYLDMVKIGDTVDITYARGLLLKAEIVK